MGTHQSSNRSTHLGIFIGLLGIGVGVVMGFLVGTKPLYPILALCAVPFLFFFFARFEQAVIGLLVLRSSLDAFSSFQLPAVFAIALDALTILYVTVKLLVGQPVKVDKFWWFFISWLIIQSLWVVLLPLGGLGLGTPFLSEAIREWVRLLTWALVYLLVMQLKDKISPKKFISGLFLSLIIPVTVAFLQMSVPSLLPPMLSIGGGGGFSALAEGARIRGTFGMANTFVTFLLLFIGLTWWKLKWVQHRWRWLVLLSVLTFLFVSTKSLFSLMMLAIFVLVVIAPRLNLLNLTGGILLFGIVVILFASSEFGQQRLASIANTPLLNPDIDVSRAILLSQGDHNSFNWRLSQWNLLLNRWQEHPFLGYGLGLSVQVAGNGFLPHNDYIRALIEGGIVGFITYIGFFFAQAIRLIQLMCQTPRNDRQYELCFIMLAILASLPIGMITENIWSHTTFFFYWWALFAVLGWNWSEKYE
jgi:O-antigen ligase